MKTVNRRNFIGTTLAGAAGIIAVPTILSSCSKGINDRVLIGHIGQGSRGQDELKSYFVPNETSFSVATCYAFLQRREATSVYISNQYKEKDWKAPKCIPYLDFEEILQRDDIDAVHITTPDHWHLPAAIRAARAGKHIMLAKPLGLSYPHYKLLQKELIANNEDFITEPSNEQ